jgi:hypothetical protein
VRGRCHGSERGLERRGVGHERCRPLIEGFPALAGLRIEKRAESEQRRRHHPRLHRGIQAGVHQGHELPSGDRRGGRHMPRTSIGGSIRSQDRETAGTVLEVVQGVEPVGSTHPPHRLSLHGGTEHQGVQDAVAAARPVVVRQVVRPTTDRDPELAGGVRVEQLCRQSTAGPSLGSDRLLRRVLPERARGRSVQVEVVGEHHHGVRHRGGGDELGVHRREALRPGVVGWLGGVVDHRRSGACPPGAGLLFDVGGESLHAGRHRSVTGAIHRVPRVPVAPARGPGRCRFRRWHPAPPGDLAYGVTSLRGPHRRCARCSPRSRSVNRVHRSALGLVPSGGHGWFPIGCDQAAARAASASAVICVGSIRPAMRATT